MIALFPPSSRIVLPRRLPTISPTLFPTAVDPVTEKSTILLSDKKLSPSTEDLAIIRLNTPSGRLLSVSTLAIILCTAIPVRGVFELGFQITTSPAIAAIIAFHAQTATGKLNAVTIPTIPSGWYWSYILWSGRSECIVIPFNNLACPTAKSQTSIIS